MIRVFSLFALVGAAALGQDKPGTTARPSLSGAELIDSHIEAKWKANGIKPAKAAEDYEFLRRAWLDICGVIPPADEVARYLKDDRKNKESMLVDTLIATERYAEYFAEFWEAILIGYDYGVKNDSKDALYYWLRDEAFSKNLPYDEMVRRLINSKGSNQTQGNTVFLWRQLRNGGGVVEITGKIARSFMGTQIQCAQCHDHPFDRYTQEDFYGVASFFTRVRPKKVQPQNQQDQEFELYEDARGEITIPEAKDRKPVPPKFLDGAVPTKDEPRRQAFGRILTRKENLQFAMSAVNRYWGHFFGRGIVHPVEEFNDKNKPSHPELLKELAQDFIDHKYDLKWLVRTIATSKTYQLSSSMSKKDAPDPKFFACAPVRMMTPEQLFNSLMEATGAEDLFRLQEKKTGGFNEVRGQKTQILRQFRFTFGDDESTDIADFAGTIPQALLFLNGELMQRGVTQQNGRLDLILRTRKNLGERLDLMFMSALGRHPNNKDLQRFVPFIQKKNEDRVAFEDVYWTLLNTTEFMFIH